MTPGVIERDCFAQRGCEEIDVSGFGASHRSFKRGLVPQEPAASAVPLTKYTTPGQLIHSLNAFPAAGV